MALTTMAGDPIDDVTRVHAPGVYYYSNGQVAVIDIPVPVIEFSVEVMEYIDSPPPEEEDFTDWRGLQRWCLGFVGIGAMVSRRLHRRRSPVGRHKEVRKRWIQRLKQTMI